MTNRERDLLTIRGLNPRILANRQADLQRIAEGAMKSEVANYGIRIKQVDDSHWWDALSSLMLSNHETSISSLNDDNRIDERDIEILEEASDIIKVGNLDELKDLLNFYLTSRNLALYNGDTLLALKYDNLATKAREEYNKKSDIIKQADDIVKDDKNLISASHNPIIEVIGDMLGYTAEGAGIGAAAGSVTGVGGIATSLVGAAAGLLYGVYNAFDSGKADIDRSAYKELTGNRLEDYKNSILTRLSYKNQRLKQIEEEQSDIIYWKTKYPVSDYYRYIEQSEGGSYLYYNLPGIIGSSFSDTKNLGLQVAGTYGLMKLASKTNGVARWGFKAASFVNALVNGWQQSLSENHAEVSDIANKKIIDILKSNKPLKEEMLENARKVASELYGLSLEAAKNIIDEETALMMYQGGVGGLNPRKLENNYDYYKAARKSGDAGADMLFARDMMATAGTDVLEAALMVTPYGAFAKKSKVLGRAVAGAAVGAATGQFLGFGVGGSVVGGITGGVLAQNRFARRIWKDVMRRGLAIEDKVFPKLERQILFDKGKHAFAAFGVSSLAEAAEEGVQYLNSLDAEKILDLANLEIGIGDVANLFVNDLGKRGEVFNAVLSQFGLTDSPYQNDQEFWSNWKGGLFLGGIMSGAMVTLQESIGAKKAHAAAKYLRNEVLSSAVANRTASQDAILKGAAFAKYAQNGSVESIIDVIDRVQLKNKNRTETIYTDDDFEELKQLANRIISKANRRDVQKRLTDLGYELWSDEANMALSADDYYLRRTEEIARENQQSLVEKTRLMNDPKVLQALDDIAGPELLSADSFDEGGNFTFKRQKEDGTVEDVTITHREKLLLIHQNAAELIAIAQLLLDLETAENLIEYAKSKGIAFSKDLIAASISMLKDKHDSLANDLSIYTGEKLSPDATRSAEIEHLKTYLLDLESGLLLADSYRDSTLRMLNQHVYTNIIRSLAISTNTVVTDEVLKYSLNMTKRFTDNVRKNKALQEIIDYTIENEQSSESEQPSNQESQSSENVSEPEIEDTEDVEQEQPAENKRSIWSRIKGLFSRPSEETTQEADDNFDDEEIETDEPEPVIIGPSGEIESEETDEPETETLETPSEEEQQIEAENSVAIPSEEGENLQGGQQLYIEGEPAESSAIPSEDPQENATVIEDQEEGSSVSSSEEEDAVIIEEQPVEQNDVPLEDEEVEVQTEPKISNLELTIQRLTTTNEQSPRKLMDGWYVTKDGRIIPSGKMYMANPVEASKKGSETEHMRSRSLLDTFRYVGDTITSAAKRYRLVAAEIRFNVHLYILHKNNIGIREYVTKILNTADVSIINTVSTALMNGDQNAVKLLIMHANPRAWFSYYVNEFFRDAAKKILNGQPVQRPEYIDKDTFRDFCRQVLLYKRRIENIYGWKFVTNIAPSVTTIGSDQVVADPDFVAVDKDGNAHIVNIYTINNYQYKKQQQNAESYDLDLKNTKHTFSQHTERSILADMLMKGIRDGAHVQISSAMLLPVVVDGYTSIHRLYLGKFIPLAPTNDDVTKYTNQEDQLLELKELLVKANEKAKRIVEEFNLTIEQLRKFANDNKLDFGRLKKEPKFIPRAEPTSIAEAYAQLDYAQLAIDVTQNKRKKLSDKEILMLLAEAEAAKHANKEEISKEIDRINSINDETLTNGIEVDILNGDEVIDNKDLISEGKFIAVLDHNAVGMPFVRFQVQYREKTYNIRIHVNRDKKYGVKNGGIFKQNYHPVYTEKMREIAKFLEKHPDVILTFDIRRSFVTYEEKPSIHKPTDLNSNDSILSQQDINNLGVQLNDGKIVDIGFFDLKTGAIQTGQTSLNAVLGRAPEGQWWQNQMFLVIKQKHLEVLGSPDRHIAIPLIKAKFNKQLSNFIAQCYRTIALSNHDASVEAQKKKLVANQLLHLFISKRLVYKKGEPQLPNVVYINGDAVVVNGKEFLILTDKGFSDFVAELQKCEIMPSWDTFNIKLKNLATGPFSSLYAHFSNSNDSFKVKLGDIDSGLEITKEQYDNDTLCLWLVKNNFFATKYFVENKLSFSLHNVKLVSKIEQEVKNDEKEKHEVVKEKSEQLKQEPKKDEPIVMSEEEFEKLGLEEVSEDDEDDEDDEYASPIISTEEDTVDVNNISNVEDAIKLVSKAYPKLAKLLKLAVKRVGAPRVKITVLNKEGEWATINGVERQKQGSTGQDKYGNWEIVLFKSTKRPIKTIAHELVHIFTLSAIKNNTAAVQAARIFYSTFVDTFSKDEKKLYAFKSFKEFVAEFFASPELLELLLSKAPLPEEIIKTAKQYIPKGKIRTALDSVISFFSRLWQKYILRQPISTYSQVYDIFADIIKTGTNEITEESADEYQAVNHSTGLKVTLENCNNRAQLRAAIDGIMTAWIKHENITALGKNIDKLNFSTKAIQKKLAEDTEFAQWYQRTFTYSDKPLIRELTKVTRPTDEKLKSESNPEGFILYEKKVKTLVTILKKDGTTVTKTVKMPKTFTTVELPNWNVMTPIVDEFMADMRIETRKKIENRRTDEEIEEREEGRNVMGELLTESYEISPFEKASREVKWLFSTIPYGEVYRDEKGKLLWRETTDHNEFGFNTFMPFRDVYGKVLYYTAGCRTTAELLLKLNTLAETGPDRAMFKKLYETITDMIANKWRTISEEDYKKEYKSNPSKNDNGEIFDANVDSTIIKVIRALRLQQNDFVWAYAETVEDKEGNKSKSINIVTTLYQKGAIQTINSWRDLLATGMSGTLKWDRAKKQFRFNNPQNSNVFQKIYFDLFAGDSSFISAFDKFRLLHPEDVVLNWRYFENGPVKFSELEADDVKMYLHNALMECGVDISEEIMDEWIRQVRSENPTITNDKETLYLLLSDQNSNSRPGNFFERLANINFSEISENEDVTLESINNAFKSGFIKKLANLQNEYDLKTRGLMTVASHNNQYYIVSERNYVNDVAEIINSHDANDKYIQMLEEDSFASGSVVLERDKSGKLKVKKDINLRVATFVGMKTKNIGDTGRDYFEIELDEDFISKLELLHEGYMIAPTTSDKKTYHAILGLPMVGMLSGKKSNTQCYLADYKTGKIDIIDFEILDRFISYFKSERDAVEKAIVAYENKFYQRNPGKKIANYSDKNGMYFCSFNCLPMENGDKVYLNENGYKKTDVKKTVQDNGKIRLSLKSHTDENPRQIVLEPQGNNKYYVHIRIWDGDHIPGKISNEDKALLFDALYNELPDNAEILVPKSGEGYYATRGTVAALQRLAKDNRFQKGTPGSIQYKDKDDSIKTFETTSFIKINNPRVNLAKADRLFFNASKYEQRKIMQRILLDRANEDIKKAIELGLVRKTADGYENIGLDGPAIEEMSLNIARSTFGEGATLRDYVDNETNEKHAGPRKAFCISSAIQEYLIDCSIKHLMSMQEYQRLFSGSKSFYKWKRKGKYVTDISVDYTKRRGGDISTGGVNVSDIDPLKGMEELGTYRCIEVHDQTVESTTFGKDALIKQFEKDEFVAIAASMLSYKGGVNAPMSMGYKPGAKYIRNLYEEREKAEDVILDRFISEYGDKHKNDKDFSLKKAQEYALDMLNIFKLRAKANAMLYFKYEKDDEGPINVADGATYITDRMAEKLLREEGKWDDDMKYAFEVLRGEHGAEVLSEQGADLYKSILNVIIGAQKYTATGFRKSDDGLGGTLMTPYYNKTALFPLFEQIAYGKTYDILQAMRKNNVDVLMMTSAVKTGSQGPITIDELLNGQSHSENTYVLEIRFLRKQLNTDPNEKEESNFGTLTIKIALSNLRAEDDYVNPFTGETVKGRLLYQDIMRCYNILTDVGFEKIVYEFAKKDVNGNAIYENSVHDHLMSSTPVIDKKALSDFLREQLMSRDANSNMFDTITYDGDNDRLGAPVSAISLSGWIDSILSSYISKNIIDTSSPGAAYIQRSIFSMEGDSDFKTLNDGKDLRLVNDDGSMDAVISIDFFKDIIPDYDSKTFEEAKEWLVLHHLVGQDAKTYTISYRIPTQAQSSINALKFVDVIPIVRDTIILPKDFTKLTGSDFDIDKLFLSRMFINPDAVKNPDEMFTFYDNVESGDTAKVLKTLHQAFINKLFSNYITLLMDKRSYNTKWRPIDADTDLWKDVYKDLYPEESSPVESMQQDTLAYQTEQKNNFVIGKIGIGPYALNNNNHIYTMLYNISVKSFYTHPLGEEGFMNSLHRDVDIYYNSIMSWLSGGINAHVDIAKDPFVTKLNINKYTYNISTYMLRAGYGRNALWFLNQPVIKELATRQNRITGQYLKNTNKSQFDAQAEVFEKYKKELAESIPKEILDREISEEIFIEVLDKDTDIIIKTPCLDLINTLLGRPITVKDILLDINEIRKNIYRSKSAKEGDASLAVKAINALREREFIKPYMDDLVEKDKTKSMIYREAKYGNVKDSTQIVSSSQYKLDASVQRYVSLIIFDNINRHEAKTAADIVKFTKIDTKKHGSTIAAQLDYLSGYNKFIRGLLSITPRVFGMTMLLFGITEDSEKDVIGFNTCINLRKPNIVDYTSLPGTHILEKSDITTSDYIRGNGYNGEGSFIHNKTRKAINVLTSILHDESVEATYGFLYIWNSVKNDFGKSSLTEDMLKKLRASILGAIKTKWAIVAMKRAGINPQSLFKDTDNSLSLAHELVALKIRSIRHKENGRVRLRKLMDVFKNNELLKILHDGHAQEEYTETDKLVEVFDFIKVHIPFTDDTRKADVYIDAWRELYNNEYTKDFAVKLMFYSLLTSNDEGGNNLFKYVPFEMLLDYGLFDAERLIIDQLNDLGFLYDTDPQSLENFVRPIVDRVETILCQDFDFCQPVHIESIEEDFDQISGRTIYTPKKLYTGYANVFGNYVTRKGETSESDRIPYIFIPARISYNGYKINSETVVDSYGSVLNRPYIRVYNPEVTAENQEKYLIYKRIGQMYLDLYTVLPIYLLTDSSMYTLGLYKIYNYENELGIRSRTLNKLDKYVHSSGVSVDDLNDFIKKLIDVIESYTDMKRTIVDATEPLDEIDNFLKAAHKLQLYENFINRCKTYISSMYEDDKYLENYISRNNKGRDQLVSDLEAVRNGTEFTQEEKDIATKMLDGIKDLKQHLEQAKAGKKTPKSQNNPSTFHMHSGGADGSDTAWAYYATQYGVPNDPEHISHYYYGKQTPKGNVPISKELFFEGMEKVMIADQSLHRLDKVSEEREKKIIPLLARNWLQVKNSDAVFAIGVLKQNTVDGGTGWAVLMAIDSGKPVHVFDLNTERWYRFDNDSRSFVYEPTPKLTKNFAGIGTRSIDRDIERKTANQKRPVKYIGDEKRLAAIDAMNDVFKNTFGDPKSQPKSLSKSPTDVILEANPEMGKSTAEGTVASMNNNNNPEFTLGDNTLKGTLSGNPLKVVMASEHTDPAFHSKKVCDTINEDLKKPKSERKYHMLQIMTKHDGLPLLRMLELNIPKSVHFSISSLGGTQYEPGVMKMDDLMDRIEKFIKNGKLKPQTTTIRIDPIIPGVTKMEDVAHIMERAAKMGIKSIKVSIMDSYGYNEQAKARGVMDNMRRLNYDFDKYYYKYQAKETTYDKRHNVERIAGEWYWSQDAKPEIMADLYQKVDLLAFKHGVFCTTCGEKPNTSYQFKRLFFAEGCLNATGVASVLGVKKEEVEAATKVGNQRPGKCNCLNCKSDVLAYNDVCLSQCAYCYAEHGSRSAMLYYNEDGTLRDDLWTRTEYEEQPKQELTVDPESWSLKEGWSVDYFERRVRHRIDEAWQIEYELVSEVENTNQESSFTYSDGTTIKTPFLLTVEQAGALERIELFISSDEHVLTVSGYAGTGKTSVMQIVAEKHKGDRGRKVVFTASTNAASGILGQKVSPKGFEATTLDKYFKLRQTQRSGAQYYNARDTETLAAIEAFDRYGDIVIIDEASMITKDKYDIILNIANRYNLKIIFLGDIALLPPVGESVSPVFLNNENLIQLTQVKRTGDNAILKEATRLRLQNGLFSYESEFNGNGEGVAFTSNVKTVFETIEHFIPELKTDNNALKIIAGTNEKVERYNNFVRQLLGYDTPVPQPGELMSGYNNWGRVYDPVTRTSRYKIVNSETYTVVSTGKPEERVIQLPLNYDDAGDTDSVTIKYTPVTLKSSDGVEVTVPYTLFEENAETLVKIANVIQKLNILANAAKRAGNKKALRLVLEKINELEKYVFTNRDVNDNNGYTIVKKAVDFGYAITAHKSQGSTYKHIIIDKNNMDSVSKWTESEKQRMYYTAVSRATTTATVYTSSTKVEGNASTGTPTTSSSDKSINYEMSMYFSYGTNKRSDVTAETTFDAILLGERTATTRYESDYIKYPGTWDKLIALKEGDIISVRDTKLAVPESRRVKVRITKPLHKLSQNHERTPKSIIVSTSVYTSETAKNKDVAVVFTENMQAEYARRSNTPSSSILKTNPSAGKTGTNQAVVRMSDDNTYNSNAFGLVVKKYLQTKSGEWIYDDRGNFQDNDSDFKMFKEANEAMFERLDNFNGKSIMFPASAALGKAALPKRFAEWLAQELYNRYGLFTVVRSNPKYEGKYGFYIYQNTGTINVYSGSKTSITNLSNFEYRPFKTELAKDAPVMKIQSVEHAFLMSKLTFAWQRGDISDQLFWQYFDLMKNAYGSGVKSIGRSIPMSQQTVNEWNKISDTVLEVMMLRSFQLNAEAASELLRTGNAKFTHNYDNGSSIEPKTPNRFGTILAKIRSKLKDEQQLADDCK